MTRRALVSGGGIAGLASAFWLQRTGWEVRVLERADAFRDGGQNVDVRGLAREVVDRMGILETIRERTTIEEGTRFVGRAARLRLERSPGFCLRLSPAQSSRSSAPSPSPRSSFGTGDRRPVCWPERQRRPKRGARSGRRAGSNHGWLDHLGRSAERSAVPGRRSKPHLRIIGSHDSGRHDSVQHWLVDLHTLTRLARASP
nr:FAD-dependent monooxygenase [Agrococcus sp. SGAir0287]